MAQPDQYTFSYKEVVEALIKEQGLHEGLWALHVEFGLAGANAGPGDDALSPTAIVPILKIGLTRAKKPTNLTADAAVVNPPKEKGTKKVTRKFSRKKTAARSQ